MKKILLASLLAFNLLLLLAFIWWLANRSNASNPSPTISAAAQIAPAASAPTTVVASAPMPTIAEIPPDPTPPDFIDVTKILAAAVKQNQLAIAATNDNFTDPSPNNVKQLRVYYTVNGNAHACSLSENEQLQLPAKDDGNGPLIITRASYGIFPDTGPPRLVPATDFFDVTKIVASAVQNNQLSIDASNGNFTDPANGIVKQLTVHYKVDDKPHTASVAEDENLTLPKPTDGQGTLTITQALYGNPDSLK